MDYTLMLFFKRQQPGCEIASFPGLHAQLLSLAVRKAGKAWTDLSRDACCSWCDVL